MDCSCQHQSTYYQSHRQLKYLRTNHWQKAPGSYPHLLNRISSDKRHSLRQSARANKEYSHCCKRPVRPKTVQDLKVQAAGPKDFTGQEATKQICGPFQCSCGPCGNFMKPPAAQNADKTAVTNQNLLLRRFLIRTPISTLESIGAYKTVGSGCS